MGLRAILPDGQWFVAWMVAAPPLCALLPCQSIIAIPVLAFSSSFLLCRVCSQLARSSWDVLQMDTTTTLSRDLVLQVLLLFVFSPRSVLLLLWAIG